MNYINEFNRLDNYVFYYTEFGKEFILLNSLSKLHIT